MNRSGFTRFAYYGLAALGALFVIAAAALTPFSGWGRGWALPAGLLTGLSAAFFAPRLSRLNSSRAALAAVMGAALLTGFAWLMMTRVSPVLDFLRMLETAAALANGTPIPDPEYQALFPHLLGYPFVLSLFFRVFGASVAAAQALNLLFSLCIAALLFSIGKKLLGVSGGLAAGLMWALLPSHFMLLSLVASEPLHIALTLCAARLWLWLSDRFSERFAGWALLGLIVGLSSLIRPVGPVYLVAFALCAVVFVKGPRLKKAASVALMAAVYLIVTAPMTGGFGWNLYVGMNRGSEGGWNAADAEVLMARLDEGLSPSEIQARFTKDALERVGERLREGDVPRFLAEKFTRLWCQDSFTVYWLSSGAREDSPLDIPARTEWLIFLCNSAYGFLLGCCALSLFRQVKTGAGAFILPVTVLTGAVLLFLLLEANPRYHYAGSAMLCLLAAGCVTHTKNGVTNR